MKSSPIRFATCLALAIKTFASTKWPASPDPIDEGYRPGPWSEVDTDPDEWLETWALEAAGDLFDVASNPADTDEDAAYYGDAILCSSLVSRCRSFDWEITKDEAAHIALATVVAYRRTGSES